MATQNTFVIEYGLTVGTTEVISSAGKLASSTFITRYRQPNRRVNE